MVGALVDRSGRKKWHMAGFAWAGSFFAGAALLPATATSWQLGAVAIVLSSILAGCSLVSYYAILVDISTEDERDRVSSRGWAFGYLGGGLLLALNLAMVLLHGTFGLDKELAVRLSLLSAALWWAGFTIIPVRGLRDRPPRDVVPESGGLLHRSFGQLFTTLREMRGFPMTLTFLVAFLFYNDGIQTVIGVASTYGAKELGFGDGGPDRDHPADPVRRVRRRADVRPAGRGVRRLPVHPAAVPTPGWSIVVLAVFLPREQRRSRSSLIGVAIAIVLGGTQALSRSFFSLLIPRGREGEYFALYNACERGTSWFGTFLFGVVFQLTGSYRPAIVALIVFFVLGAVFLLRLDPARGRRRGGQRAAGASVTGARTSGGTPGHRRTLI